MFTFGFRYIIFFWHSLFGAAYKKKKRKWKEREREENKGKGKRRERKKKADKKENGKLKDRKGKERKILKIGLKVPKLTEINLMTLKSNREFKNPLRFV